MRNSWELGYQIAKPYRNHGYACEVVQLFLPWIMKELKIDRIDGDSLVENKASAQILRTCGFCDLGQFNAIDQGPEAVEEKFVYTTHSQDEHV